MSNYPSHNGQFLHHQQSTSPYQHPAQPIAWDPRYATSDPALNVQSLYNSMSVLQTSRTKLTDLLFLSATYGVPQAAASPSQFPMYYSPPTSTSSPFSQPTQYPPLPLSAPAPYPTVSAAAVPVPQRHSYPPTSYHQSPVMSASRSTSVSPPRSASTASSPGSSQFSVIAPGGRTLASSSDHREAMHTARSMQRGDGIHPADDTRQCPHCGKVCDRPSTLRTHLNSHTGLRRMSRLH